MHPMPQGLLSAFRRPVSLRLPSRLVENDLCAISAIFFLYGFDPSRHEQCLSLALATVAAPVCEHSEARSETVAGEVQRRRLRFVLQCCCGLLQLSQFVLRCRFVLPWDAQGTSKLSCSLSCHPGNLVAEPFCGCCYVLLQWQRLSGQSFWQAGLLALLHDSIAPLRSACFRRAIALFPLAKHAFEVILEAAQCI